MKAVSTLLIGLMLVLSVFAAAGTTLALDKVSQVPVSAYDTNNAKLTVDTLTVTKGDTVVGKMENVQSYTFLLTEGEYVITATKDGYKTADADVKIEAGSPSVMPRINLKLEKIAEDGGDQGSGQDNGSQPAEEMKIKLDINPDDKVKPGDEVEFKVGVDNRLGYDAEDVNVDLTIKGIDDGDDWEDDADIGDLDYKDEETQTFTYTVPYDADDKKYDVLVEVTWEDADGNKYYNTLEDTIEVEKEKHDVAITNAYLSSETIEPGKDTEVAVEVANIGKNDEDVRIKVAIPDFGVEEWTPLFDLKDGDTALQYIPFTVPADAEAGKYLAEITVLYNDGADTASDFVTLTIGRETAATTPVSITPMVTTVASEETSATTTPADVFNSTTGAVIVGILLLLAIIAYFGKEVMPKKATIIESTKKRR